MASRVFHTSAFPTGAHHPFMGPEDHSAHPGWATVAGNPQGTLCSCWRSGQASGCLWVSRSLTEEPGTSSLLSCPPHHHPTLCPFSSNPSPIALHIVTPVVASGFMTDSCARGDLSAHDSPLESLQLIMISPLFLGPAGRTLWEL